jgi:3-oxoacyl-[acyl-carrier-protein] synthase II
MGVLSPIGCDAAAILSALREGRSGLKPMNCPGIPHLHGKFAGEVPAFALPHESLDRTAGMAVAAACKAWQDANIPRGLYEPNRIGLCVGASGAGLTHNTTEDVFRLCFQPHEQAAAVARALNVGGPVVMFSSASAGSGLALVQAIHLLRSGRCDVVAAGGAECLSQVNHESMDSMRLCSVGPCSPFSGDPGLTVGEGSAFFLLERLDDASARGAPIHAELFSFGVTQDAYDIVGGDPSGEGLVCAFTAALNAAGLETGSIGWIKANGTSNRDQDAAETIACKQVFTPVPPITALESFVGHANGAAPAIGLSLALIAFENGLLPATLNFARRRAGCDLDYVPNQARESDASRVLASSVGFGGSNVALVFGKPNAAQLPSAEKSALCITGIGVVSAFGHGFGCFVSGLREGKSAIRQAQRWPETEPAFAGLAEDVSDRRIGAKLTLLQRFALAASMEAFESANFRFEGFDMRALGVMVGLSRGSAAARSQYAAALSNVQARKTMGKLVVRMGRFTVASVISQHFKVKGYGGTIAEGIGAGLHALAHACIHLENCSNEQALLVVAADEIGPGTASSLKEMSWLAAGHDGCYLQPYDCQSKGTTLGEGAVALLVERTDFAKARGAKVRAHIEGVGLSANEKECSLADAIHQAIEFSGSAAAGIAGVYGNGSGIWQHDQYELQGMRQVLPRETPLGCANVGLGLAESTSGLFQVAASLHALETGEFFPVRERMMSGRFPKQLVTATTEGRRNAALVLGL